MESAEDEAQKMAQQIELQRKFDEASRELNHTDNEDIDSKEYGNKKISRNEPCPCKSGKKYKQCCGKSGPKKGIFAS
jgi:preprotein translocase subunit SecA